MKAFLLILLLGFVSPAWADTDTLKHKQVHSNQINPIEDMVWVAESNGYPSPTKVLRLQNQLKLSAAQQASLATINQNLSRKSKEMQTFIKDEEKKLAQLFASHKINDGTIIYYSNKIGALQGELRNAYLKAHFETKKILNPTQIKTYKELSIK